MRDTVVVEESVRLEGRYFALLERHRLSVELWRQFDQVGIRSVDALLELMNVGTPTETLDAAMTALDDWRAVRSAHGLP